MRVYFAAAMTSGKADYTLIRSLMSVLKEKGAEVLTTHVADPQGKDHDLLLSDEDLARRDLAWLRKADCLIAEVSTPSHGVGIEVMAAVQQSIPVLLLAKENAPVSRLLRGLPGVIFARYQDAHQAANRMLSFFEKEGLL